jgi:hypothetical protein
MAITKLPLLCVSAKTLRVLTKSDGFSFYPTHLSSKTVIQSTKQLISAWKILINARL